MSYSSYSFRGGRRGSSGGYASRGSSGGYRGSRGGGGDSWIPGRGRGGRGGSIGYSGGRGGSSSFSGSSHGRGRYESGGSGSNVDSYESRSRYSGGGGDYRGSSSRGGGRGSDMFSSSRNPRYSRESPSMYDSRSRESPDGPRKRIRMDNSYQGSSMRRSHDDGYGGGNDHSNRSFSSSYGNENKDGVYGDRSRLYHEDRAHSRSNEYSFRKVMGPPTSMAPRRATSGRRGLRGSSYLRASSRLNYVDKINLSSKRKFKTFDPTSSRSLYLKRKYLKTVQLMKLKRRLQERIHLERMEKRRRFAKRNKQSEELSDELGSDEEEEIEVEEEVETSAEEDGDNKVEQMEEDGEEVEEKSVNENGIKKDNELEDGEAHKEGATGKEEKGKKRKIVRKIVKKIVKRKIQKDKSPKKSTDDKDDAKDHNTSKQEGDDNEEEKRTFSGRPFIKLQCPHCAIRCITFERYNLHLQTLRHKMAMKHVSTRLKSHLANLRIAQRREQLSLDKETKGDPNRKTIMCSVCRLYHRSLESEHEASSFHKKMNDFLLPFCNSCKEYFNTPISYEHHLCDLNHIKREARIKELKSKSAADTGRNVDMDNFMILDSVGSPDGSENESDKEDGDEKKSDGDGTSKPGGVKKQKRKKTEINLGLEYCKKIEVILCDLCNIYLPRNQPYEKVIGQHCRSRSHLERLVRANKYIYKRAAADKLKESKDDKAKTTKEEIKIKKEKKDESTDTPKSNDKSTKTIKSELEEDADIDDKVWSEVDKDLGDILREVDGKTSDEDEDEIEAKKRYDRFKLSEKESVENEDEDCEMDEKGADENNKEDSLNKEGANDESVIYDEEEESEDEKS